ncbi:collagen-like protein [Cellulophaga sp. F20128]|uniref:collagen-like protein n=1 Tax=Cellulophaga sp. F20128 TaxID=2926413 RepID=UPI001FF12979|nr:collagen-like protein [Cellulophaga sp. F20128]MCK0156714.1 collagen-like protein [Cellulophaga sp. F20128]
MVTSTKSIRKILKGSVYFLLVLLISVQFSCSSEDGEDGMDGLQGAQGEQGIAGADGADGTNGTDGADGQNGTNGTDGADGEDGTDGADGNANVRNFTFDASTWSGSIGELTITQLTSDVLANDAILTYLTNDDNFWFQVPCPVDSYEFDHAVFVTLSIGLIEFDFADAAGQNVFISAGDLTSGKVIIIEATSTTALKGTSTNKKEQVLNELIQAGVDVKDYKAVCDYYGIEY